MSLFCKCLLDYYTTADLRRTGIKNTSSGDENVIIVEAILTDILLSI